jgi:hypothetical protein
MSAEGVVIGTPGACVTLSAAGAPKTKSTPDFAADYPAMMTYEVGPHSGTHSIALVGTPAKYSYGFVDSLKVLESVSADTTKPYWRFSGRPPFVERKRNGLPRAYLLSADGELHIEVQAIDVRGHIRTNVKVKPLGRSNDAELSFSWDIDQSYLPALANDLRREFPGL